MRTPVNLLFALRSLRDGWSRAILSALGITVGSAAIALLVSIALGVRSDVENQVRDLGVNVLVVVPGRLDEGTFHPNFGGASYLADLDATALAKVPGVVRAEPFTFVGGGIRRGAKVASPFLAACTPGWFAMRPVVMRDQDASNRVSLDRYDFIRSQQLSNQPPQSAILGINQSPVLPQIRPDAMGPNGVPQPLSDVPVTPIVVAPSAPASAPGPLPAPQN